MVRVETRIGCKDNTLLDGWMLAFLGGNTSFLVVAAMFLGPWVAGRAFMGLRTSLATTPSKVGHQASARASLKRGRK